MTDARFRLPSVNRLLEDATREGVLTDVPHSLAVRVIRRCLADARARGGAPPDAGWIGEIGRTVADEQAPTLEPVINATGVVVHTNLGRAPLATAAVEAIQRIGTYNTIEYDLADGRRGSRQSHVRSLLCELTGAEEALVVTNAAAALVVLLNTHARDGETIVSRGELVEIGGSFRIPDILERSGTRLVEVGTTNRTRIGDYENAWTDRTGVVLKVHRSNFIISGFTEEAAIGDLVTAFAERPCVVAHDVGSGLMADLSSWGLEGEPRVHDSVRAGAVTVFSGDKLLGGPQAGILVGPRAAIAPCARNPLARAMRPDKIVLAALEATLALYRDPERARREIPVLAMLTASLDDLSKRATGLAAAVPDARTEPGTSSVGGGAFPNASLPTLLVAVPTEHPDRILTRLREASVPVIARAGDGRVLLDPRTLSPADCDLLPSLLAEAFA